MFAVLEGLNKSSPMLTGSFRALLTVVVVELTFPNSITVTNIVACTTYM